MPVEQMKPLQRGRARGRGTPVDQLLDTNLGLYNADFSILALTSKFRHQQNLGIVTPCRYLLTNKRHHHPLLQGSGAVSTHTNTSVPDHIHFPDCSQGHFDLDARDLHIWSWQLSFYADEDSAALAGRGYLENREVTDQKNCRRTQGIVQFEPFDLIATKL